MKKVCILGSTGSIGTQSVDVIRNSSDRFRIIGLSTNKNIHLLYEQILEFNPPAVCVMDYESALKLKEMLGSRKIEIFTGIDGLINIATLNEADTIIVSVVGMVGLIPTLKAINCNKEIALANKETLVAGGAVVKKALEDSKSKIRPVDSEHCAIFQCLQCSKDISEVEGILITASGGPFRGKELKDLNNITPEMALRHPKWSMGPKISIDSATLMNKGLEVIEAHWLFDIGYDKINVVIHKESIVHSMVEYIDGSVIAQLGVTDMRIPIMYALGYPDRISGITEKLDLISIGKLTFEKPDMDTFRCLKLAYDAGLEGGTMPVVLNSANEVAVDLFLKGVIRFLDIPDIVERAMTKHINMQNPDINDIIEVDKITRRQILKDLKVVY